MRGVVVLVLAVAGGVAAANVPLQQAGPHAVPPPVQVDGSSYRVQYPTFYMRHYHNNERSGVVAEDSFEDDNTRASSEQVVSYSYLAAPKGHLKDVVYGSGAAAKPPSSGHTFSARSPTLSHISVEPQNSHHTNPIHTSGHTSTSSHDHITPLHTHFESSKLSSVSSPQSSHSPSSAPSSFFPSSFSPSPLLSSSPSPPPSLPPASPFTHPEALFAQHQPSAAATLHPADPSQFIIKDSTFQAFPGAPTFSVPLPIPHNQITSHPVVAHGKREQLVHAGSDSQSSYVSYQETTKRPIYQRVMDPFRKVGERIYKAASPVFKPMMDAGHRLSERFQLDKRMSAISESLRLNTVDSEALPVVAGVGAITAIGLAVLAVAAANNATTVFRKRSIDDVPTLRFLDEQDEGGLSKDRFEEFFVAPMMTHALNSSPRCSKRVVCDIMTYLPDNYLFAFEKELQLFLNMLKNGQGAESSLRQTADGFLKAVKERKCSQYTCGDEQVDTSQILTVTSGPR